MNAPVTRRVLLGATAAAGVLALPAVAEAGIPASHPDAGLLDLIARHEAAVEAVERARATVGALVTKATALYPFEPDALLRREDDFIGTNLGAGLSDRVEIDDGARRYGPRAAAWLRSRPATEWYVGTWKPTVLARWEERRQEVLRAWTAREATRAEIDERCGLAAAERIRDHHAQRPTHTQAAELEQAGEELLLLVVFVGLQPLDLPEADRPPRVRPGTHVCICHGALLSLVLVGASQRSRRRRATAGGKRATTGGTESDAVAAEARDIVRRAVGDAAGLTVKAQVRQAARNLGFAPESWRPREAFYGRAGGWGAVALDDLRARFAAWRGREAAPAADLSALALRVRGVRDGLARLDRELAEVEAEVARMVGGAADA